MRLIQSLQRRFDKLGRDSSKYGCNARSTIRYSSTGGIR